MRHSEYTWKNVSNRGCWDSSSPVAKLQRGISSLLILSQGVSSSTWTLCLLISLWQAGSLPSNASLSFGSSAAALFSSISSSSVLDIVPDMENSITAAKLQTLVTLQYLYTVLISATCRQTNSSWWNQSIRHGKTILKQTNEAANKICKAASSETAKGQPYQTVFFSTEPILSFCWFQASNSSL